ncbi:MAG: SPFH domain-containing protein [Fimbriimonas sp.]
MAYARKAAVAGLAAASLTGCMTKIPPSSVGIKFNAANGISEKLLKPELVSRGLNERIIIFPTAIRNASFAKGVMGEAPLEATTSEGAKLAVDLTVAWHVEPSNVLVAFEAFGTENLDEVARVFVRTSAMHGLDTVAGTRSIFALTSKERGTLGARVKGVIAPILEPYGITVDDVALAETYPSEDIQESINLGVAMTTEIDTKKSELQKAIIDAKTVETNARKTAELNRLFASQSGQEVIAVKKLEILRKAIAKWKAAGGKPPTVGSGAIPFTDISLR